MKKNMKKPNRNTRIKEASECLPDAKDVANAIIGATCGEPELLRKALLAIPRSFLLEALVEID